MYLYNYIEIEVFIKSKKHHITMEATQQATQDKPSNSQDNKKLVDMTQEELSQAIEEQAEFIKSYCIPGKYETQEIAKAKATISDLLLYKAQEFQEYKRRIEGSQARIKEAKKQIKEAEARIKEDIEFKEGQEFKLQTLTRIKDNLKINPNYYKK